MRTCQTEPTPALPPWATTVDRKHKWVTAGEFARIYKRSERWGRGLCESGEVHSYGFQTYLGGNGRWWVRVPINCL